MGFLLQCLPLCACSAGPWPKIRQIQLKLLIWEALADKAADGAPSQVRQHNLGSCSVLACPNQGMREQLVLLAG